MRLRRLELTILALTLAFAFFMGGFFTGRTAGTVSIAQAQPEVQQGTQIITGQKTPEPSQTSPPAGGTGQQQAPPEVSNADSSGSQTDAQTPAAGTAPQGTGQPKETDGKININTATHGELTDLPGIGNVIATRIIDYRTQYGSFAKTEDIQKVSGIGERKYEAIRELIKVG